jgi:exodeoxyribonuclease V alpha subunit
MTQQIILTSQQQQAVSAIFAPAPVPGGSRSRSNIHIIHGGPGTGKTTAIHEILSRAAAEGLTVTQCAPTGKAAKRMMETTNYPASTIHRAFGIGFGKNGESYQHGNGGIIGDDGKADADLLIIDETSMVTNNLMATVLQSVDTDKTRVLLVGDPEQLPSVGAGAVLRDMIASGRVPNTELTEIQRNAGRIVKACHKIRRGKTFDYSQKVDLNHGENFKHIEVDTVKGITDTIRMILMEYLPRAGGFDPVWDTQVIAPTNEKSGLSCAALNQFLQGVLNPAPSTGVAGMFDASSVGHNASGGFDASGESDSFGEPDNQDENTGNGETPAQAYREGDKIIWTKNLSMTATNGEKINLVNGDMGVVDSVPPPGSSGKQLVATFHYPDRTVKIPVNSKHLRLAYAITCHRFQGSESPVVIIPIHKSNSYLIDRCWLYTAISRAQVLCFTVGQFDVINRAIGRVENQERQTFLRELIREEVA